MTRHVSSPLVALTSVPSPPLALAPDILSGGLNYNHKVAVSGFKAGDVALKADLASKGTDFNGTATANFSPASDVAAEVTVSDAGVVKAQAAITGLLDGLKTTVSAEPMNAAKTLKIANQLLSGDYGVKADVTNIASSPKADASVCVNLGDAQIGAEAAITDQGVGAYSIAAQLKLDDLTLSAILADKLDTVKAGALYKLDADVTAAAEAIHKVSAGSTSVSAGVAAKLASGHSARIVISSAAVLQGSYSGEIVKGVQGTACLQVDSKQAYKYGVQIAYKN